MSEGNIVYSMSYNKNLKNLPLQTINSIKKKGTNEEIVLNETKYVYKRVSYPDKYFYKLDTVQTALTPYFKDGHNVAYYPEIIFDEYDILGNSFQVPDKNGIRTSYVWGYGGLYPVAVIENSPGFSEIKSTVGVNLNLAPLPRGLSTSVDRALRNKKGVSMSTFDYKPFVGPIEIIDPTGRKTTYDYNGTGKLIEVKDDLQSLLKSYEYSVDQ